MRLAVRNMSWPSNGEERDWDALPASSKTAKFFAAVSITSMCNLARAGVQFLHSSTPTQLHECKIAVKFSFGNITAAGFWSYVFVYSTT